MLEGVIIQDVHFHHFQEFPRHIRKRHRPLQNHFFDSPAVALNHNYFHFHSYFHLHFWFQFQFPVPGPLPRTFQTILYPPGYRNYPKIFGPENKITITLFLHFQFFNLVFFNVRWKYPSNPLFVVNKKGSIEKMVKFLAHCGEHI